MSSEVHLLDVELKADAEGHIIFNTYRKPQNIYDYCPPLSAHTSQMIYAVVRSEMCRLIITNSTKKAYGEQVLLFMKKLKARGYNMKKVGVIMLQFPWSRRKSILDDRKHRRSCKILGAKVLIRRKVRNPGVTIKFSKGLERLKWHRHVNQGMSLLSEVVGAASLTLATRWSIGTNLFRRLYSSSWRD